MSPHEQRLQLRAILAGDACVSPASVHDAVSVRIAERVGFRLGMLGGSVASISSIAAPDIALITLTELAAQVRGMMRGASHLSLFIDADHAYGNALNAMRTVEELEHAGAAGFSIEDTRLPQSFGMPGGEPLLSIDEMVGKLRGALTARRDPALVIAGRTSALVDEDFERGLARAQAYAAAGVDAIFLAGLRRIDELRAIHEATQLPLIVGAAPDGLDRTALAAAGVRIFLTGHQPIAAVIKTLTEVYAHFHAGGSASEIANRLATKGDMDEILKADDYARFRKEFLE